MTTVRTIWKKLTAAVFWILAGGLALLGYLFHSVTPRKRPAARHARPRPADEDAKTVLWLARLHDRPARVMAAPFTVLAATLQKIIETGRGTDKSRIAQRATGSLSGDESAKAQLPPAASFYSGVPAADVDHYLAEHAELYAATFDDLFPVLAGELAPLPWIGQPVGDIVFEPTLPPLPEPARDWRPHACGDVDRPTAILRPFESELTEAEPYEADGEFIASVAPFLPPEATAVPGDPGHDRVFWGGHYGQPGEPGDPEDVPGPAESAPPPPEGSAEAVTPPAAVAGPGTPDAPGPETGNVSATQQRPARGEAGAGPGAPADDTVTDMPAIAARAFVGDMLAHPGSGEPDWLERLYDTAFVRAVSP